ncbi:tetratricopeptide repeat protein [Cecembia rubra]|uniref:tetratricopeptide repeat protein n=1 Tax=Cecembia rubra TaxID=1485585 RepID=UPI0027152901|nr:tetratricopeptide repeat protein [Cecembia rubra]
MSNFDISIQFFKEGKFEEALVQINSCIDEDVSNKELYFFRARVQSRLGNLESALEDFDYLVNREPYNPNYISDRAVVLHLLKRNEEALDEFDRALNLEPLNAYRYSSRAYFKDRIGDLKGAIEDYEKAIELDPEDAVSYNNKGLVEEKLGYKEKSQRSFKKADDLIGYKSVPTNKVPEEITEKGEFPRIGNSSQNSEKSVSGFEKLTFSKYLQTLKNVFTDKSTRQEFLNFIKAGFKKRAD